MYNNQRRGINPAKNIGNFFNNYELVIDTIIKKLIIFKTIWSA